MGVWNSKRAYGMMQQSGEVICERLWDVKKERAEKVTENWDKMHQECAWITWYHFFYKMDAFQTEEYKSAKSLWTSVWYHKGIIN